MADVTLNRPEVFPPETAVGVYPEASVVDLDLAPHGAATQTQTVSFVEIKEEAPVYNPALTAITFTGLSTGTYYAAAKVKGIWRYVRFTAGKLGASLKPPARYPKHSAGN